jgi:hypothetical protein
VAETNDVGGYHPKIIRQMKALAEKPAAELGDGEKPGYGVRKTGYVYEALPMNAVIHPDATNGIPYQNYQRNSMMTTLHKYFVDQYFWIH